jgi:hypothetical protein
MLLKFINDKRVSRIKAMWKREREKAELFEREYIKERDKRMELEKKLLDEKEKAYIRELIKFDRVINSHKHTSQGLYSELDVELLAFTDKLLDKLSD